MECVAISYERSKNAASCRGERTERESSKIEGRAIRVSRKFLASKLLFRTQKEREDAFDWSMFDSNYKRQRH